MYNQFVLPIEILFCYSFIKVKFILFHFKYTQEAGFLSYYEICQNLADDWISTYNEEQQAPYATNGIDWVGYENSKSITVKVR